MDKSVLLVLLCLQVFLLITAFTSTDAAAMVRDDQLSPDQVERRIVNRRKRYFQAGYYPGGTGLAIKKSPFEVPQGLPGPHPPRHDGYFMCGYYAGGCVIGQAGKPTLPPPPRPDIQA